METQVAEVHVRKDVALEGLRGLAAFIVVAWHLLLGFAPALVPVLPGYDLTRSIMGKPWFGLVYGTSSVTFFFVLSGFVLSRKAIANSDPLILARGAVKRWPRLAAPVMIAVLVSWALFHLHAYSYVEAGAITNSIWLKAFASSLFILPPGTVFTASLSQAFQEGLYTTFFKGTSIFNSSLWTMNFEFIGSFLVFSLATLLIVLRDTKWIVRALVLLIFLLLCPRVKPLFTCFVFGVALASLLAKRSFRLPLLPACGLIVMAIWFAGYYPGAFWYGRIGARLHFNPDEAYVHTVASLILIFVIETTPALRRVLSGRWSVILGKLSFPVYLLHIPVLCSAGTAVFLAAQGRLPGHGPQFAAAATTVIVTVIIAWPLALFDIWWVRRLGAYTDRLVPRPVVALPTAERADTIH